MKYYIITGISIVGAVSIDSLLTHMGLPIVVTDLILVPLSITTIVFVCAPKFLAGNYIDRQQLASLSGRKLLSFFGGATFLVLLGGILIYLGFLNPLQLFSGAKGAVHGYTLVATGSAFILLVFSIVYVFFFPKDA